MSAQVVIENRARLDTAEFALLKSTLEAQTSMERALTWFTQHTPPLAPEDLIAQDEFSFDLLVRLPDASYLSYDTS
jgi:hypothetical protein